MGKQLRWIKKYEIFQSIHFLHWNCLNYTMHPSSMHILFSNDIPRQKENNEIKGIFHIFIYILVLRCSLFHVYYGIP
jgi:hypothetical protein